MSETEAVNPTKQHAMSCRKLSGNDCTCDGYHTFDELYDHRIRLFITLCLAVKNFRDFFVIWASKKHSNGDLCFGTGTQFILGIGKEMGSQITYHLPISYWDEVSKFAEILEHAPEWDRHTSADVLERLKTL